MNNITNSKWFNINTALLILRIGIGIIFINHGLSKLGNMDGTIAFFASLGLPAIIAWATAIVEALGGLAVILGIKTRLAALGLAIIMLGVFFTAKRGKPFGSTELEFILLLANLALIASGSGKYALGKKKMLSPSADNSSTNN